MWRRGVCLAFALLVATAVPLAAQGPKAGKNKFIVRGQQQEIYYLPAQGGGAHRKVLYAPGDGGWRGFGVTIAEQMAAAGFDVYGLDTRTYLESFTTSAGALKPADIAGDYRQIANWIRQGSKERILLAGWSEGAGLGLAAAADASNREIFDGLVAIGMTELNILGWRWSDFTAEITKKVPNEPTFRSLDYTGQVAPLALFMIASTGDEYVAQDATRRLFAAAHEPKRLAILKGDDHKFGGNTGEFFQTLREALNWIGQKRP